MKRTDLINEIGIENVEAIEEMRNAMGFVTIEAKKEYNETHDVSYEELEKAYDKAWSIFWETYMDYPDTKRFEDAVYALDIDLVTKENIVLDYAR